jgi:hypothetical protein
MSVFIRTDSFKLVKWIEGKMNTIKLTNNFQHKELPYNIVVSEDGVWKT